MNERRESLLLLAMAVCIPSVTSCDTLFSPNVRLSIVSPETGATFAPGDVVSMEIATENFTLEEPAKLKRAGHPTGDDPLGIDDHEHPAGTVGHYHVYLDEADGTDPHVTDFKTTTHYTLPDDLSAGTHTLRVVLRNPDHTPLSETCPGCTTEATVEIECVTR